MRGRDGRLSSRAFSEACLSLLQVAKRLRCSACRGSAVEYHAALAELRALRNKAKIKDFEYTEALDPVCEKRVSNYGLQLRSNLPTQKFSKDKAISRATGNWAGRYITNVCAELYADYEEDILRHQKLELLEFVQTMCHKTMKVLLSAPCSPPNSPTVLPHHMSHTLFTALLDHRNALDERQVCTEVDIKDETLGDEGSVSREL